MVRKPKDLKFLAKKILKDVNSKKIKRLFVTGTDTNVGKTFICCEILESVQNIDSKLNVTAVKPIATGCKQDSSNELISTDAVKLFKALNGKVAIDKICKFMFEGNISPQLAIQNSMKYISINDMELLCKTSADFTLVEGAGGLYSPLASDGSNAGLAKAINCPVILVVKDKLGCINHTLLTLEALNTWGLEVYAIVLNKFPSSSNDTIEQIINRDELKDIPFVVHSKNSY